MKLVDLYKDYVFKDSFGEIRIPSTKKIIEITDFSNIDYFIETSGYIALPKIKIGDNLILQVNMHKNIASFVLIRSSKGTPTKNGGKMKEDYSVASGKIFPKSQEIWGSILYYLYKHSKLLS